MLVEFRFILQNVCLLKITPAKYFLCIKKDISGIYFFSSYLSLILSITLHLNAPSYLRLFLRNKDFAKLTLCPSGITNYEFPAEKIMNGSAI